MKEKNKNSSYFFYYLWHAKVPTYKHPKLITKIDQILRKPFMCIFGTNISGARTKYHMPRIITYQISVRYNYLFYKFKHTHTHTHTTNANDVLILRKINVLQVLMFLS